MTAAFLFPGQGAQIVGMGTSLRAGSPAAADIFERANAVLGFDLAALCERGPQAELDRTDIAQPAIYTVSAAALAALTEVGRPKPSPSFAAGLSLGEFSALYAAGVFSFEDGLRLVQRRGQLMQQAAEAREGSMASIIALDDAKVRELCSLAASATGGGLVVPANFLCPGNIVISGDRSAVAKAVELAESLFRAKAVPLAVAGAFHTAHMTPAAEGLATALAATPMAPPKFPVIANADAQPHGSPETIPARLVRQLDGAVLWEQSLRRLLDSGVAVFYEVGPCRVLAGLLRRVARTAKVVNIQTVEDVTKLAAEPTE